MEANTKVQSGRVLAPKRSRREPNHAAAQTAAFLPPAGALADESRRREHMYRRALASADVGAGFLAAILAVILLGHERLEPTILLIAPLLLVAAKCIGLYDRDELLIHKTTVNELPQLFQLAGVYMLCFWLADTALVQRPLGKGQAVGLGAVFFVSAFLLRREARKAAARLTTPERLLFIGDERCYRRLQTTMGRTTLDAELGPRLSIEEVITACREDPDRKPAFAAIVARAGAHRVLVGPHRMSPDDTFAVVQAAREAGARVSLLPDMLEVTGSSVAFDDVFGTTVLGVRHTELGRSSRALKRSLDLAGASFLTLCAAPALAIIAIAIKLDSPGPILFRQTRVGRDGRLFRISKFRTMCADAEALKDALRAHNEAGDLFKLANDPRVTRVGRLLRKTSLDELPQLLNVLSGEMSLVGPRPLVVDEDAKITGVHRGRLRLTPGMTGVWQVLGSSRAPMEEMVKLDHLYVSSWTLWSDLQILIKTIPYVLLRHGQ